MKSAPTVKTDPVLEAIAKALFGIDTVPAEYRPRMIKNAARAARDAARKELADATADERRPTMVNISK